ncbi:Na+/H+ antiporter [Dyella sp. C11]|uniref:Na+/H+ antiporter n=1 Tax=Dyella sp. C11 TaxID=2126991 RepID=UPI000D6584D0|nr:Na+/H+ antiporter [Dyella sp. C11]
MGTIAFIVLLLGMVVLSSIIVRSCVALPLPMVQIALGAVAARVVTYRVSLEPAVLFQLFLAPLLFLDGWRIPRAGLFRDKGTILSLALGLVLITVLGIGAFIHWLIPAFSWPAAFALAAILSPTDTIAVSSVAARVPLPRRLMLILEGESLLNDASGLVCFRFAVVAALTGNFALWRAAGTFLWLAVGGLVAGAAICLAANAAKDWVSRRWGEDVGAQILVSLIIPFAAYLMADAIGASGILAAVAAGLMMGIEERAGRASAITRIQRAAVWDAVQFAGNGVIFVLLGHQLPEILGGANTAIRQAGVSGLPWFAFDVLAVCVALAALRAAWTGVALGVRYGLGERVATDSSTSLARLVAISTFAGARGAVTLAAAMAIPLVARADVPWPARDVSILMAAGVILVSLVSANAGLALVTRPLKRSATSATGEENGIRSLAALAALQAIEQALREPMAQGSRAHVYAQAGGRIAADYHRRIAAHSPTAADKPSARQASEVERRLRLVALAAERKELNSAATFGRQSQELIRELVYEIDLQESQLTSQARRT